MASNNNRLTPRQKMINLMYIVLTAMLALNVSSDVLNGFKQVEDGLERSTSNASLQNDVLYQKLADFNSQNPEKEDHGTKIAGSKKTDRPLVRLYRLSEKRNRQESRR